MGQQRREGAFGRYLRAAINAAGYATPTHFARAVGTDPSVVLRWISGKQRPTIRSIERVAPVLGRTIHEMVEAAYPESLADALTAIPQGPSMHPLAQEIGRMLADDSDLAEADRHALASMLDRLVDPYRRQTHRRRPA